MSNTTRLPRTVEELTPQWLAQALQSRCPGIGVVSFKVDNILWGTATKVLVDVTYKNHQSYQIPNKLCIKGELDEKLRAQLAGVTMTGTQVEAGFYNDIGPKLGVPMARHWYADWEPGMGILILDNMAASGYTFGAPTKPWTPELVGKALDILAILHGSTWGKSFPDVPWLQVGSPVHRGYAEFLMSEKHWKEQFSNPDAYPLTHYATDRERSLRGWRAMWAYDDANSHCLVHGDTHLGNMCIDPAGNPFFIDWAAPSISHWGIDVAYFVTGSLSVADRRANEKDLLRRYLDGLARNGGPRLEWDAAWADYGRHLLQGLLWGVLPPTMQPREYVAAMGERYCVAMQDHDTFSALGV
jgi:Phosphotransferase enzyme family